MPSYSEIRMATYPKSPILGFQLNFGVQATTSECPYHARGTPQSTITEAFHPHKRKGWSYAPSVYSFFWLLFGVSKWAVPAPWMSQIECKHFHFADNQGTLVLLEDLESNKSKMVEWLDWLILEQKDLGKTSETT